MTNSLRRLSRRSKRAQTLAADANHQAMRPIHLLVALVEEKDGVVPAVLTKLGITPAIVSEDGRKKFSELPAVQGVQPGSHLDPALETGFHSGPKRG